MEPVRKTEGKNVEPSVEPRIAAGYVLGVNPSRERYTSHSSRYGQLGVMPAVSCSHWPE
jgi:hypothetical protein